MKNTLKAFALVTLLLLGLSAFGQTSLTQTTLGAAQSAGPAALASGLSGTYQTTVNLASATGITQSFNGQPVTFILIGNEVEGILTLVTGQTTIYNVLRGQMGTKAAPHPSGDMVLAEVVTPQFGGFSGSGGLQQTDPPYNGNCTAANTLATPWINVFTGAQWECSSITNTWVPGWNNPMSPQANKVTAAVASASSIVASGPLFHVTGTTAVNTITGIGFNNTAVGGGQICMIPDALGSTGTSGNIAIATTFVVNKLLCETWDATNSKFVPSY